MARLVLQFEGRTLHEHGIGATLTIGRLPDNGLVIENPAVSGRHARVVRDGDDFVIEDLESTNGTFVNGTRVTRQTLQDGDELLVGKHKLRFELAGGEETAGAEKKPSLPDLGGTMYLDTRQHREMLKELAAKAAAARAAGGSPAGGPAPAKRPSAPPPPASEPPADVLRARTKDEWPQEAAPAPSPPPPKVEAPAPEPVAKSQHVEAPLQAVEAAPAAEEVSAVEKPSEVVDAPSDAGRVLGPARESEEAPSVHEDAPAPAAAARTARVAILRVMSGRADEREYRLRGHTSLIGKSESALVKLKGWFKPQVAVAIARKGDRYVATHLGGKTMVNDEPLKGRRELEDGDVLQVSGLVLEFTFTE